ncbi:hypothetical protein N7G274_003466 [Stereocaulon virgatum]|uniref:Uncharacterized protein n=1 Tax=Stereocaulon virgatum TaxID=373712 RepID=A0ABR4AEN2_9LECA
MDDNMSHHRHLPLPPNSSSSPSLAHQECAPSTKPTNSDKEHSRHATNVLFSELLIHPLDTSTDHRFLMRILHHEILRCSRRPPTALLPKTLRHIDTEPKCGFHSPPKHNGFPFCDTYRQARFYFGHKVSRAESCGNFSSRLRTF